MATAGRPKKNGRQLNIKLDETVYSLLDQYIEETGQQKTVAIERMLSHELKTYFKQEAGKRVPR